MKLPIQLVPGTKPPQFRYYQSVGIGTTRSVECQGCAPSAMEAALIDLIRIAEQLAKENEELRKKG